MQALQIDRRVRTVTKVLPLGSMAALLYGGVGLFVALTLTLLLHWLIRGSFLNIFSIDCSCIEDDRAYKNRGQIPVELQVSERLGTHSCYLAGALDHIVALGALHLATLGDEGRDPEHEPHVNEPRPLKHQRRGTHRCHQKALREQNLKQRGGQSDDEDELEEPVVVPLFPHVVT